MKVYRSIRVTITPEDMGETWPDYQKRYASSIVFRPDSFVAKFSRDEGCEVYMSGPDIAGYRVLKDGTLSKHRHGYTLFTTYDMPAWAERAIVKAREVAEGFLS